jgi:hypothetical protein
MRQYTEAERLEGTMWPMLLILGSSLLVQSPYAVRSVEELKLMTEPELARESRLVCRMIGYNRGELRYYGEQKNRASDSLKTLKEVELFQSQDIKLTWDAFFFLPL